MMNRRLATAVVLAFGALRTLSAQDPRIADSLLLRGSLDRAESEYYAAVRARPRDPNVRLALGRYLLARGATRPGMTLVEEAVQFGLDKRIAARPLAMAYMELGEYQSLGKLSMSPLSASEKAMVGWLAEHPSTVVAPDSSVLVAFTKSSPDGYLGALRIRLNGHPVLAAISPRSGCGIRLSDTSIVAAKLRRYPADSAGDVKMIPSIADSVGFGRMSVTNQPVEIEPLRGVQAVICLSRLAHYAPTFDPRASLMTIRLGGKAPAPRAAATSFPLINLDGRYSIAQGGGWAPIVLPQVSSMLRNRRWTVDARRGVLTIEP